MKKELILFCLLAAVVFSGCRKFVQVSTPYTLSSQTTVFADPASATAAQVGIYAAMISNSYSFHLARRTGAYGDELVNYDQSDISRQLYTNALNPSTYNDLWTNSFTFIYQINAVLDGLDKTNAVGSQVSRQLRGEARFSKALIYFYLVNLYGGVPYPIGIDYKINGSLPRLSEDEIWKDIIADAQAGADSMSDHFVDAGSLLETTERTRPNRWAALALLSKANLHTANYPAAETISTEIISNSLFSLDSSLSDVFLKNSTEAIWQLEKTTQNQFYADGYSFNLPYLSTFGEQNSASLSANLISAFENGDKRKDNWVGTYTDFTGGVYYFPFKYKETYVQDITEYTMIFRLAEQFLVRAEARAKQQKISDAVSDLNVIRNRAGLPPYAGPETEGALLDAISRENQVEMFSEMGNRWLDLKRTGQVDSVMAITATGKGGSWSSNKQLWPIPKGDVDKDKNLTQNPGY